MLLITLLVTIFAGVISLGAYLYFYRQGQFEDIEDVKYQMFREEDGDAEVS